MAEDKTTSGALARTKLEASSSPLALPGYSALEFETAWPDMLDWFEATETIGDFDASGMFSEFQRLWLGYDPQNRDQLTISVYCARIMPERVALASDYARLLASVWGPKNYGVFGDERDFGEVLTGEDESGFARRTRISVWRRGAELLILRADTTTVDLEVHAAALAAMIGSLEFLKPVEDTIIASLVAHRIRLPSGASFEFRLPPHWRAFDESKAEASPIAASVWLDGADEGGNSAIGIFGITVPEGAQAKQAPMRDIATTTSDLLMENLAPKVTFRREPVTNYTMKGFSATISQVMFIDRLAPQVEGQRMTATGFFMGAPSDVVGFSALTVYPTDQERMGIMMHSNFIDRLVLDELRAQFGGGG